MCVCGDLFLACVFLQMFQMCVLLQMCFSSRWRLKLEQRRLVKVQDGFLVRRWPLALADPPTRRASRDDPSTAPCRHQRHRLRAATSDTSVLAEATLATPWLVVRDPRRRVHRDVRQLLVGVVTTLINVRWAENSPHGLSIGIVVAEGEMQQALAFKTSYMYRF